VDNTDQKSATITGGSYTSQQLQQMLATKLAGGEECDLGANN